MKQHQAVVLVPVSVHAAAVVLAAAAAGAAGVRGGEAGDRPPEGVVPARLRVEAGLVRDDGRLPEAETRLVATRGVFSSDGEGLVRLPHRVERDLVGGALRRERVVPPALEEGLEEHGTHIFVTACPLSSWRHPMGRRVKTPSTTHFTHCSPHPCALSLLHASLASVQGADDGYHSFVVKR